MSNEFNGNNFNSLVNVNEFANGLTNIDVTRVVNTGIHSLRDIYTRVSGAKTIFCTKYMTRKDIQMFMMTNGIYKKLFFKILFSIM